jgi:outer membrane lipoprotein-sorting protein
VTGRWLVVLLAAATLVGTPLLVRSRTPAPSDLAAVDLAQRVLASRQVAWAGTVHSSGTLQVPDNDSFANLAQLLGEDNDLRVWWRSPEDWRVDRLRGTGETDLFRQGGSTIRWVFESSTATVSPVSDVRLPDASDLLPPTLGRSLVQGARDSELSRLPVRRVAGVEAPGLRLVPEGSATTVERVDLWVDPASGLPLQVELTGRGGLRPLVRTTLLDLDRRTPDPGTTIFDPPATATLTYEDAVDVAAAAEGSATVDLPAELAGLGTRSGRDPGAVGVYGRGPTSVLVVPLRGQVAYPLRERLRAGGAEDTDVGTLATLGPVGLLVTADEGRGTFLLAGTVTGKTLQRAAAELGAAA